MKHHRGHDRWIRRAVNWRKYMADLGLDGLLIALAQVARPMGPLAAQMLWVAQPTLGALDKRFWQEADSLATLLDSPAALDRLLAELDSTDNE